MRALDAVRGMITMLAGLIRPWRRKQAFSCGECERWQRCGLPPNDRCIVMVAQLARGARPIKRFGLPPASGDALQNGRPT